MSDNISEEPKRDFSKEKKSGLHGWFQRQGGKGKSKGWVDCNTCRTNKKTGRKSCKACGRSDGEKRGKPRCRPTPSQCKGYKKPKKENNQMDKFNLSRTDLLSMIEEEIEELFEKEKKKKDDRCTRIAKRKYDVWPSAYASGAVVKCRDGKIWKGISEEEDGMVDEKCQKGYKTHPTQKTKEMYGKTYRNCIKAEHENVIVNAIVDEINLRKEAKPAKGKRFAKKVKGKGGRTRTVSYGQAGKAKDGGDRIRPGTKKAHAYCARSNKIKKCKNPPCANTLSRKKWKCQGDRSVVE